MLKSLLGIALLTASNSAATFQTTPKTTAKQPQIQMANSESVNQDGNVDYDLTLEKTNQVYSTSAGSKSSKSIYTAYNSYLLGYANLINYQYYQNADSTDTNSGHPLVINDNSTYQDTEYYSQTVLMIQITPYQYNTGNQVSPSYTINYSTSVVADWQNVALDGIYVQFDMYITTNNMATYFDSSTYYTNGYVNGIMEDLESPEMGYTYLHSSQQTEMWTQTGKNHNVDLDFDITLVPKQTNYIFIFSTVHAYSTEELNMPRVRLGNQVIPAHGSPSYEDWNTTLTAIHITGTGIIPPESTEIVDIPGVMFEILGMPWYFISTAFNLTLFPGTPYQLNISSLFLAIIAVFIFIFLLRLLLKVGK